MVEALVSDGVGAVSISVGINDAYTAVYSEGAYSYYAVYTDVAVASEMESV